MCRNIFEAWSAADFQRSRAWQRSCGQSWVLSLISFHAEQCCPNREQIPDSRWKTHRLRYHALNEDGDEREQHDAGKHPWKLVCGPKQPNSSSQKHGKSGEVQEKTD